MLRCGGLVYHGLKLTQVEDPCSTLKMGSRLWEASSSLHPGTLLVATPAMLSPYYFGTVVCAPLAPR